MRFVRVDGMRWMLLACLIVAGCLEEEDGEGDHLIVHVHCTSDFDSMLVTLDQFTPSSIDVGVPTQTYDWDYWAVFTGEGPRTASVTVLAGGDAVATGRATEIVYITQSDGTRLAEISMPLTP